MRDDLSGVSPPVGVNVMKNKLDDAANYKFLTLSKITVSLNR